ncbi:MAG: V-type ATP synthase subunit D [Myxococcota bacterium]
MTTGGRASATRSTLVRFRRRLEQVRKGAALLKRKRESLVEELFKRARPAVTTREAIEQKARAAWRSYWAALSEHGADALTPQGWPTRQVTVDLEPFELWGLKAVALSKKPQVVRSIAARGVLPGSDGAAAQVAAHDFEALVEALLDAAPQEHVMRRLGQALARTTRLVNTLEQRVAVKLAKDLSTIRRTLEEREREEHLRLKRLIARRTREAAISG